jgi:hypothetical protein
MNSKNKNPSGLYAKKFNADMQNQLFQIPVFPRMLNRDLDEQLEHRVLGPTTLYQAQYPMSDVPCKCSLVSGGAYGFVASKCEPTWRFVRNQILSLYKQTTITL